MINIFVLDFGFKDVAEVKKIMQEISSKDELYHVCWQTDNNIIKGISYFTNFPVLKEYRLVLSVDKLLVWKDFDVGFYKSAYELPVENLELFYNCKSIDEVESKLNKLLVFQNGKRPSNII